MKILRATKHICKIMSSVITTRIRLETYIAEVFCVRRHRSNQIRKTESNGKTTAADPTDAYRHIVFVVNHQRGSDVDVSVASFCDLPRVIPLQCK